MDTRQITLYTELKKYLGSKITHETLFKAIVFCMKYVKKLKTGGDIKKQLVIEVIMMLVKEAKIDIDESIVEFTLEQVYEMFQDNFKSNKCKCF